MEGLYYQLLKELYDRYGRTGTSLNAFILKLGKEPDDLKFTKDLKKLIEEFEETGIVAWNAEPMNKSGSGFTETTLYKRLLGQINNGKNQTFENIYVEVKLTFKGLDYAGNIINRELTRKSIMRTNSWMIGLTFILAFTSMGTLYVEVYKPQKEPSNSTTTIQDRQQQKKLPSKDTTSHTNLPNLPNSTSYLITDSALTKK